MKQQVSPVVVVIVILVVVGIAAAFIWKGTSGGSAKDVNDIINAGVAKGGAPGTVGSPPPGVGGTSGRPVFPNMGSGGSGGAPMQTGLPGGPSPGAPPPAPGGAAPP